MRLVRSSEPGADERDRALALLSQRAVLTRSACAELRDAQESGFVTRRAQEALYLLLQWVASNFPDSVHVEPHASDGLDRMNVPDDCGEVFAEVSAGADVCEAFFMLLTADTRLQAESDRDRITSKLEPYWSRRESPAPLPWF